MQIAFYILGFVAVVGALCLLVVPNPVYCALGLVGSFFCMAGIFILLGQEFVAAIQVLVYAGAIMVLFLFVIMLLNLRSEAPFALKWTLPKLVGLGIVMGILAQLVSVFSSPAARLGPAGDYTPEAIAKEGAVQLIGSQLYTHYVLPFEVISVLLMVAVVGAVLLAKRRLEEAPASGAAGSVTSLPGPGPARPAPQQGAAGPVKEAS